MQVGDEEVRRLFLVASYVNLRVRRGPYVVDSNESTRRLLQPRSRIVDVIVHFFKRSL